MKKKFKKKPTSTVTNSNPSPNLSKSAQKSPYQIKNNFYVKKFSKLILSKKLILYLSILILSITIFSVIFSENFNNNLENFSENVNQSELISQDNVLSNTINSAEANSDLPKIFSTPVPQINAKAFGIYKINNENNFEEIYLKNSDLELPPASVTKVMTAILALEKYDLNKPVVIPANCVGINGSNVGFRANEVFSLEDLLYGLLVRSGADAACAIANITNPTEFVAEMNEKAKTLGMKNTIFTNEIGFDIGPTHLSTVQDLKILNEEALNYSAFKKLVGTKEVVLQSLSSNSNSYRIKNTNDLLFSIPGTIGIKTGFTETAGECLVFLYENRGQEILIIILGSQNRFKDTNELLEWAKAEFSI